MFLLAKNHTQYPEYMEFHSLAEAQQWGLLHFADWFPQYQGRALPHFAPEDVDVKELFMYLGYGHRAINNELRNYYYLQYMDTAPKASALRRISAQRICDLISQRVIADNIILYRIIDTIESVQSMIVGGSKKLKKGSLLIDKGFMSTSLVYETLQSEMNGLIVLCLLCPKGYKGAYVDLLSKRPKEQEVLLPPNSAFTVIRIYRNKDRKMVFECLLQLNDYIPRVDGLTNS